MPTARSDSDFSVFSAIFSILARQWQRRRVHGPAQVMLALMVGAARQIRSYRSVLEELFEHLSTELGWTCVPSASGFAQARRRLAPQTCIAAFHELLQRCTSSAHASTLAFGQHRLLAVDGTRVVLPVETDLREHFGCPGGGNGASLAPQATLTLLWEIGANRPLDWRLAPYRSSERMALREMIAQVRANDVLLADRGLLSRALVLEVLQRKAHLLVRTKTARGALCEVTTFLASGLDEAVVRLRGHRGREGSGPEHPSIRLLRMVLPDGEIAVFLTTLLDQARYPREQLLALYTARWRIETAIREFKLLQGLEHLRATYPDGIRQEVCALMLYALLESEVELRALARHADASAVPPPAALSATPTCDGIAQVPAPPVQVAKHPYRFCRRLIADYVVRLMVVAIEDPARVHSVFERALDCLWRYREKQRKPRSFPRVAKSPLSRWGRSWGSDSAGRAR